MTQPEAGQDRISGIAAEQRESSGRAGETLQPRDGVGQERGGAAIVLLSPAAALRGHQQRVAAGGGLLEAPVRLVQEIPVHGVEQVLEPALDEDAAAQRAGRETVCGWQLQARRAVTLAAIVPRRTRGLDDDPTRDRVGAQRRGGVQAHLRGADRHGFELEAAGMDDGTDGRAVDRHFGRVGSAQSDGCLPAVADQQVRRQPHRQLHRLADLEGGFGGGESATGIEGVGAQGQATGARQRGQGQRQPSGRAAGFGRPPRHRRVVRRSLVAEAGKRDGAAVGQGGSGPIPSDLRIAVVDLQIERGDGAAHQPSPPRAGRPIDRRVPRSGIRQVGALQADQHLAHRRVPSEPRVATVLEAGQRAPVDVERIEGRRQRRLIQHVIDQGVELHAARMVAEHHAHPGTGRGPVGCVGLVRGRIVDGGEGGFAALRVELPPVRVGGLPGDAHVVLRPLHAIIHPEAARQRALQRHDAPGGRDRVQVIVVRPARGGPSAHGVLLLQKGVDGQLRRSAQVVVGGHGVRLRQSRRHAGLDPGIGIAAAIGPDLPDQPGDRALHRGPEPARRPVIIARAEEDERGEGAPGTIGGGVGPGADPIRLLFRVGLLRPLGRAPVAVRGLVLAEEPAVRGDRALAGARAAIADHGPPAPTAGAISEGPVAAATGSDGHERACPVAGLGQGVQGAARDRQGGGEPERQGRGRDEAQPAQPRRRHRTAPAPALDAQQQIETLRRGRSVLQVGIAVGQFIHLPIEPGQGRQARRALPGLDQVLVARVHDAQRAHPRERRPGRIAEAQFDLGRSARRHGRRRGHGQRDAPCRPAEQGALGARRAVRGGQDGVHHARHASGQGNLHRGGDARGQRAGLVGHDGGPPDQAQPPCAGGDGQDQQAHRSLRLLRGGTEDDGAARLHRRQGDLLLRRLLDHQMVLGAGGGRERDLAPALVTRGERGQDAAVASAQRTAAIDGLPILRARLQVDHRGQPGHQRAAIDRRLQVEVFRGQRQAAAGHDGGAGVGHAGGHRAIALREIGRNRHPDGGPAIGIAQHALLARRAAAQRDAQDRRPVRQRRPIAPVQRDAHLGGVARHVAAAVEGEFGGDPPFQSFDGAGDQDAPRLGGDAFADRGRHREGATIVPGFPGGGGDAVRDAGQAGPDHVIASIADLEADQGRRGERSAAQRIEDDGPEADLFAGPVPRALAGHDQGRPRLIGHRQRGEEERYEGTHAR